MDSDTDDGVRLGIEIVPAPESFNGERGLRDLASVALEVLLANELEHSGEVMGPAQHSGVQQPIEFFTLSLIRD
jgi:hypothetical protein